MIRNLCTCGSYSIRPYPDGRKELYLRSILDYAKQYNLLFDLENVHAELIIPLFESIKGYMKRHIGYFCRGVLHTPHQDSPKRNV